MSEQSITVKKAKRPRRRPRRSRRKRASRSVPALAAKVTALSKRVGKPELKYGTASIAATQIDFNGTLNSLMGITQGAQGVNQRSGDGINIKSFDFRYRAWVTTSTALTALRVVILVDEQTNLTASTVLATTGSSLAPISFYNKEYKGRYRVLYDKTHTMDAGQSYQDMAMVKVSKPISVVFQPTSSTVRANDLRILLISNQAAASVDRPSIEYNFRMYYEDN